MNNRPPSPDDRDLKSKILQKKEDFDRAFKENITKEMHFEPPDFVLRSSFLCFLLSSKWRIPLALITITILMSISLWSWSNAFISEWWIAPFFDSDLQETDCIMACENLAGYLAFEEITPSSEKKLRKLYTTDMLKTLQEEEVIDHVYGFDITYGYVNGQDLNTPILLGTPETYRLFNYSMSEGDCAFDGEDMPEVVLSGVEFINYHVGDIITLSTDSYMYEHFCGSSLLERPDEFKPLKVRVAGKIGFPYITQEETFYLQAEKPHIKGTNYSHIFMIYNEATLNALKDCGFCVLSEREYYYVAYKPDADPIKKEHFIHNMVYYFTANTNNYITGDNIASASSLCEGEVIFSAEKPREIVPPAPRMVRVILRPGALAAAVFCAILLILMITLTINRIISGYGIALHSRITLADIIKTAVLVPLVGFIIPVFVMISTSMGYLDHTSTAPDEYIQLLGVIVSPFFLKCLVMTLALLLIILVPAIIFSVKKYKSAVSSEVQTKESYVYREAEYYTEDTYTPNVFDVADYDSLRKQDSEQNNAEDMGQNSDQNGYQNEQDNEQNNNLS